MATAVCTMARKLFRDDETKIKDENLTWFRDVFPAQQKYKLAQTRATKAKTNFILSAHRLKSTLQIKELK